MSEHLTVITRKGQITLPAAVRRALGLHQGDKVSVELIGTQVTVRRADSVVARTAGAVKSRAHGVSARELRAAGEVAWADEATERGL